MGRTFAEKVLGKAAGYAVKAGDVVTVEPHFCMSHDNAAPIAKTFKKIGVPKVWKPDHIVFILDHAIPAPTDEHAQNHKEIREFSAAPGHRALLRRHQQGRPCATRRCARRASPFPGSS